jgi:hypothetical protein
MLAHEIATNRYEIVLLTLTLINKKAYLVVLNSGSVTGKKALNDSRSTKKA